jgi:Putative transposase
LLKTAAETLITIAADPKHLGARIGLTAVPHTWGSALTHHPHVHIIVPGGGFSLDGQHWIACRPGFFLSVRVLSRLFRRLFLDGLTAAYQAGRLQFFADQTALGERKPSKPSSPHCARSNGSFTPSGLSADPMPSSPTCPVTPTGSLLPTAGSSPATANA